MFYSITKHSAKGVLTYTIYEWDEGETPKRRDPKVFTDTKELKSYIEKNVKETDENVDEGRRKGVLEVLKWLITAK